MKVFYIIVAIASIFLATNAYDDGIDLSRGMGREIKWMTLEDGLRTAELKSKPLFLMIHKTWCGACKNLKPKLAESKQFKILSNHFVMVNVLDDEEPTDEKYFPDGGYIPRILFLDHLGNVKEKIYNKGGNPKYKYYYMDAETVVTSMELAIKELQIVDLDIEDYRNQERIINNDLSYYPGPDTSDLSRGFGKGINWMKFKQGLLEAEAQNKPLFFLSHKEWCGACQKLKPILAESKLFKTISKQFVMVNVMDDEEPTDEKYFPDGNYIPRILFFDQSGKIQEQITNEVGNPKFKYYYDTADAVIDSMGRALQELSTGDKSFEIVDSEDDFLADLEENLMIHEEL